MSKIGFYCLKSDTSVKNRTLVSQIAHTFLCGDACSSLGHGENAARNFSQFIVFYNCFVIIAKRVFLSKEWFFEWP